MELRTSPGREAELESRVRQVMAAMLAVGEDQIGEQTLQSTTADWDSLRHMNLVLALEEEFEIRFGDDEVNELLGFRAICHAISSRKTSSA
jgi:acyl carrier protein